MSQGGVHANIHYEIAQADFQMQSAGTTATTCTPGAHLMRQMLQACDELPVNIGITGKGNDSAPEALREQIVAGAWGLKRSTSRACS